MLNKISEEFHNAMFVTNITHWSIFTTQRNHLHWPAIPVQTDRNINRDGHIPQKLTWTISKKLQMESCVGCAINFY